MKKEREGEKGFRSDKERREGLEGEIGRQMGLENPCLFLLSDDSSPRAITPTQTFRHNELYVW